MKKFFECKYCNKKLSSKSSLSVHIKRAKYCLEIRNITQNNSTDNLFACEGCGCKYTSKQNLIIHKENCVKYHVNKETKILKDRNSQQEKIIKELKLVILNLQKDMKEVAIKAVSRPTHTTSNKTIQINNYIKQMEPLRIDRIKENVPMLTLDHHVKGPEGYAEYALEFPFKDRIICVDVARNKIKYKNEEGDIVEDPGFRKMMLKLCDALKDRSYKLCQDHYEKLLDKFSEEEMDNTDFDFMEAAKAIHKYANGRESEFCSKIIRLISKGSKV
jgi:hypothetical protein